MSQPQPSYAATNTEDIETAKWTRHLPEAFGIRAAVQASKYRWCVREAALWSVATSTAMTLHRFRMQSPVPFAVHIGFSTFFVVYGGSYYFCVKRRDHREKMIELMMKLNSFEHALNMPEPVPVDEQHPFVEPGPSQPPKQYVAELPERKEWQSQLPAQDFQDVFRPVDDDKSKK